MKTQISQAETSLSPSMVYHNHSGKSVYSLYKDRVAVCCFHQILDNADNSEMRKEKWVMTVNHRR